MNKRIFKNQTTDKGDVPFFKISTFGKKADSFISNNLFEKYKEKYPYPQKGDLLISASGSIGRIVEYKGQKAYYQDSNIVWLNHNKELLNIYLKAYYQVIHWHGIEGSTIKRLYNKNILATSIFVPDKKEQYELGRLIKKAEKIISLQQRKLENYLLIKKKLSNIFFNDRIVNKNDLLFEHRVKANQIFISYSKKGFSHLPVLSASQDKGMIFRKDESKNILYTHDNLTNYKLVEPDNFVVHLRSFQAGFAYSDKTGIASPAYTIFKFKNNVAYNSVYWKEKFKSYNFIQLLKKITYGVRDGRSISFSDFLSLYLTFPDIKLQNKIGNVLSKLDTQISDQKEIIKKLENIKQFLLQNMFI